MVVVEAVVGLVEIVDGVTVVGACVVLFTNLQIDK